MNVPLAAFYARPAMRSHMLIVAMYVTIPTVNVLIATAPAKLAAVSALIAAATAELAAVKES